ncbi:MAG: hypothetical protein ACLFTK_11530, partial [Anaerolineales bacterium]
MQTFYRWLRKVLAWAFGLAMLGSVVYFLGYTLTGIAQEIDQRRVLSERDADIVHTATALAPTIEADLPSREEQAASQTEEAAAIPGLEQMLDPTMTTDESALEVAQMATAMPSERPSLTATEMPTESPSPTDVPPSATSSPTMQPPTESQTPTNPPPTQTDTPESTTAAPSQT